MSLQSSLKRVIPGYTPWSLTTLWPWADWCADIPWRQVLISPRQAVGLVSGIPFGSQSSCYVMNHLSICRYMWANEKSAEWRHCEVRKPGAWFRSKSHSSRYSLSGRQFVLHPERRRVDARGHSLSPILGHCLMYEIKTFDGNVWRQVWPTLGSGVVRPLRTCTWLRFFKRHVCILHTTINSDPTKHRGYYCVQPALTLENLHFAHRVYLMFRTLCIIKGLIGLRRRDAVRIL